MKYILYDVLTNIHTHTIQIIVKLRVPSHVLVKSWLLLDKFTKRQEGTVR